MSHRTTAAEDLSIDHVCECKPLSPIAKLNEVPRLWADVEETLKGWLTGSGGSGWTDQSVRRMVRCTRYTMVEDEWNKFPNLAEAIWTMLNGAVKRFIPDASSWQGNEILYFINDKVLNSPVDVLICQFNRGTSLEKLFVMDEFFKSAKHTHKLISNIVSMSDLKRAEVRYICERFAIKNFDDLQSFPRPSLELAAAKIKEGRPSAAPKPQNVEPVNNDIDDNKATGKSSKADARAGSSSSTSSSSPEPAKKDIMRFKHKLCPLLMYDIEDDQNQVVEHFARFGVYEDECLLLNSTLDILATLTYAGEDCEITWHESYTQANPGVGEGRVYHAIMSQEYGSWIYDALEIHRNMFHKSPEELWEELDYLGVDMPEAIELEDFEYCIKQCMCYDPKYTASAPNDVVFISAVPGPDHSTYFTAVDRYTGFTILRPVRHFFHLDEMAEFISLLKQMAQDGGRTVKRVLCCTLSRDEIPPFISASDYDNTPLINYCSRNGISIEFEDPGDMDTMRLIKQEWRIRVGATLVDGGFCREFWPWVSRHIVAIDNNFVISTEAGHGEAGRQTSCECFADWSRSLHDVFRKLTELKIGSKIRFKDNRGVMVNGVYLGFVDYKLETIFAFDPVLKHVSVTDDFELVGPPNIAYNRTLAL